MTLNILCFQQYEHGSYEVITGSVTQFQFVSLLKRTLKNLHLNVSIIL